MTQKTKTQQCGNARSQSDFDSGHIQSQNKNEQVIPATK